MLNWNTLVHKIKTEPAYTVGAVLAVLVFVWLFGGVLVSVVKFALLLLLVDFVLRVVAKRSLLNVLGLDKNDNQGEPPTQR